MSALLLIPLRYSVLFTFSLILLTLQSSIASMRSSQKSPSIYTPPKLWLREYLQTDSNTVVTIEDAASERKAVTDLITKNGSDYIVSPNIAELVYACEADYPVIWTAPYPEQLLRLPSQHIKSLGARKSVFNTCIHEPINKLFRSYLVISILDADFLSASLSCQCVENPKVTSDFHLYFTKNADIEREGETVHVQVSLARFYEDVILPCRPALPHTPVTLEVQTVENNTLVWEPLAFPNKNISFDPRVGFILARNYTGRKVEKMYRCSLETDSDIFAYEEDEEDYEKSVIFNVTTGEAFTLKFKSHFNLKGKVSIYLHPIRHEEFIEFRCCSGVPHKPPKTLALGCGSSMECETTKLLAKWRFQKGNLSQISRQEYSSYSNATRSNDCSYRFIPEASSIVVFCTGKNVHFAEHYSAVLEEGERVHVDRESDEDRVDHTISISGFYPVQQLWHEKTDKKIVILFGRPVSQEELAVYGSSRKRVFETRDAFPQWLLQKQKSDVSIRVEEFLGSIYEGEMIHFMCFSVKLFYSHGAKLRVNWVNGTRTVLNEASNTKFELFERKGWEGSYQGLDANFAISTVLQASVDMHSVDCYMPVWNSSRWERLTRGLSIQPTICVASTAPKFTGDGEETVRFKRHEEGRKIICELLEGSPTPFIRITKDGEAIDPHQYQVSRNGTEDINSERIKRIISFPPIAHGMQGLYQCIAENYKGKAVKTIRVYVIGSAASFIAGSLPTIGILSLLILGILVVAIVSWRQQRKT